MDMLDISAAALAQDTRSACLTYAFEDAPVWGRYAAVQGTCGLALNCSVPPLTTHEAYWLATLENSRVSYGPNRFPEYKAQLIVEDIHPCSVLTENQPHDL